ncbi:MAG: nuclear transport factor 2 family protein [Acidimicrobiia bacterium]
MSSTATIERFYAAFGNGDYESMAACYHPDVSFSDPVFVDLEGDEARAMWHMLCEQGRDLQVVASAIRGDDDSGRAHWEATYTFSPTSRTVHNKIDATFRFEDGLIIEHTDTFDLWAWTRMALGPIGWATGWMNLSKEKVREAGEVQLTRFLKAHPEYQTSRNLGSDDE